MIRPEDLAIAFRFIPTIKQLPPNDEVVLVYIEKGSFPLVGCFNPEFGWKLFTNFAGSPDYSEYPSYGIRVVSWCFIPE